MRYSERDTSIKSNTSYFGTLSDWEEKTLDSLIRVIDFSRYDTSYENDGLKDGSTFRFYIRNDSLSKMIHIYGDSAPAELLNLGRWIADLKTNVRLRTVDSLITFEHVNDRLIPPSVEEIKKFTPPEVEP